MILDIHYQTSQDGCQRAQAWIEEGWLYLHSSLKTSASKIMDISSIPIENVTAEVAQCYSNPLGYCPILLRSGSTLQMLVTLYRIKTEDHS